MSTPTEKESGEEKKTICPYGKKQMDDKVATKLAVLKFGKGNKFHKSKSVFSEMALEEYGEFFEFL
jgi:hypothetical protein